MSASKIISSKAAVKPELIAILSAWENGGQDACVTALHDRLLMHKVRFPILEYCAEAFYEYLPEAEHIPFCNRIEALKTEGGNVLLGILLRNRLNTHFEEALERTVHYLSRAEIWYVCDIIGERVFGHSLLHKPEETIPEIKRLMQHESNMVVRSLGAGTHFAIKKGLSPHHVSQVFELLLTMANTPDKEIRQGIGWAAKTTAKFHPDIIGLHTEAIQDREKVAHWFRTKILIGLNRYHYATGD